MRDDRRVALAFAFAVRCKVGYNSPRTAGDVWTAAWEGALKALITGISGFVGSHLAEYLLEHTDWDVAGTVFGPYRNITDLCGKLELYPAELSRLDVMTFVLEQARPDVVFHLAAQPLVTVSRRDPWGTLETNIRMQLNVLEGVARINPACQVLVVGSSEEYGQIAPQDLPIDEETALRPLNPYALSKVAQDLMGLQYHLTHSLRVIRVRPFNHIGSRQNKGFVAPDFASQIAAAELGQQPPQLTVGNLSARRDFSDVRDVVRAYVMLITHGTPGEVYNVGAGESHAIQELLDILLSLSRVHIDVQPDPQRMRPSDIADTVCDTSRLREATGWQPEIPFEQSLRDVLDYWRLRLAQ